VHSPRRLLHPSVRLAIHPPGSHRMSSTFSPRSPPLQSCHLVPPLLLSAIYCVRRVDLAASRTSSIPPAIPLRLRDEGSSHCSKLPSLIGNTLLAVSCKSYNNELRSKHHDGRFAKPSNSVAIDRARLCTCKCARDRSQTCARCMAMMTGDADSQLRSSLSGSIGLLPCHWLPCHCCSRGRWSGRESDIAIECDGCDE
jgi:hypothetical protein